MTTLRPGDVVIARFVGAVATKRRPAVVVSSEEYHRLRRDVVVAVITSNLASPNTPLDFILEDWAQAGLRRPSAFRAYFQTVLQGEVARIGQLSDRDWAEVKSRVARAISTN